MSVTYRIVKRPIDTADGKELDRGTAATLTDVLENLPTIIIRQPERPRLPFRQVYVYEVQIWSDAAQAWMYHMPLMPWRAAQSSVSMSACFTTADVPLAGEEHPVSFTAKDIPLAGVDVTIPRIITPAVTYI